MLNERRAQSVHFDLATDVLRVFVMEPPGTIRTRTVAADLLLDAQGFLVGIDVEPHSPARAVVMIGQHDHVSRTVPARVGVCSDAGGDVFEVRIAGARATVRADQKNPYL